MFCIFMLGIAQKKKRLSAQYKYIMLWQASPVFSIVTFVRFPFSYVLIMRAPACSVKMSM